MSFYHEGSRALQARFGSTALADRLEEVTRRASFTDADKSFIESAGFFFLATADGEGRPDCSFKGGAPGFVRVITPELLVFPDYDGNGQFRSLGNISVNPEIGLLFIAMGETARRLRVNGRAEIQFDDPLLASFAGAQALIRVRPRHIFPNCPRYIPDLEHGRLSPFIPERGAPPLEPAWKSSDEFKAVVPARQPTPSG
jgi:predicted pyridoxine 5'-phosphate oxidase superfamily flavin-nucleotide-binding protein